MIVSWDHKGLSKAGIQPAHAKKLSRQLYALDSATNAEQLNVPGWRLHSLTGDRNGYWSLTVSGNWRVTFRFVGENAYVVNYEDYH